MSTMTSEPTELDLLEPEEQDYAQYRALSALAVAAFLLGLLSLLAFLNLWFVAVPVAGVVVGLVARKKIRKYPDELTGVGVAGLGIALCVLFGIAGPAYQGYVYATEVPDWVDTRLSYAQLQPDPDVPGQLIPPSALELNGKKVFIKGYIYPGTQQDGIRQFVLCRDQGDCCFGGNPKITDRIQVTLAEPLTVGYSSRQFKVAGTFRVEPGQASEGLGVVYYHLDGEYVR